MANTIQELPVKATEGKTYDNIRLGVADNGIFLEYSIYTDRPTKSETGWTSHQMVYKFDEEELAISQFIELNRHNIDLKKEEFQKKLKKVKK